MHRTAAATLLTVLSLAAGCAAAPATAPATRRTVDGPAVAFEGVTVHGGKPPLRYYRGSLTLRNRGDRPVWFVLPHWVSDQLKQGADGRIEHEPHDVLPVEGKRYDARRHGGTGRFVVVTAVGEFNAVLLPAGATARIDAFDLEAWRPVAEFEVWQAESLLVNGTTPLERWLPYDVRTAADAHIRNDVRAGDWENLDWDPARSGPRADLPNEPVRFVAAKVVARQGVRMDGKPTPDENPWRSGRRNVNRVARS